MLADYSYFCDLLQYKSAKVQLINKSILTIISLTVLLHSISLYSVYEEEYCQTEAIEMTQGDDSEELQLQAYDALIPSIQGMTPLVLYFIHEVVLITEAEFHEIPVRLQPENRFLKILFPLIIGPNAP